MPNDTGRPSPICIQDFARTPIGVRKSSRIEASGFTLARPRRLQSATTGLRRPKSVRGLFLEGGGCVRMVRAERLRPRGRLHLPIGLLPMLDKFLDDTENKRVILLATDRAGNRLQYAGIVQKKLSNESLIAIHDNEIGRALYVPRAWIDAWVGPPEARPGFERTLSAQGWARVVA